METGVINTEQRQHHPAATRPVSFAGIGLDEVDGAGAASFLGTSRPTTSPTSRGGRQLTFRDYGEKIKELEGENFQLKVRLHLIEQSKYGKSRNANVQQGQHNSSGQDGLTVATNEIVSEFQQLKKDNEALNLKLVTAENHRLRLEEERDEILRREQQQLLRNEELNHKLDVLDRELALIKLKKDEEDDEIEKCVKAFNSFGGTGNSTYNNNNHLSNPTLEQNNILQAANEKLESQVRALKNDLEALRSEINMLKNEIKQKRSENEKLSQKAHKHRDQITKLKEENYGLNMKVTSTCETMKEMGFQFNEMKVQNKNLLAENELLKQTMISTENAALEGAECEVNHLKRENAILSDKVSMAEKLHKEYGKLVAELKSLRAVCPVDETYERFVTVGLTRSVSHQEVREDPSPDLGIETDHEALAQQLGSLSVGNLIPESSNSSKTVKQGQVEEHDVEELRRINKHLAYKLKHTKQALESTVTKLQKTTKEKEEFEQVMCRQLHRTHNILEDAQQRLEKEQDAQILRRNNDHGANSVNLTSQSHVQNIDTSFGQLLTQNCGNLI